MDYETALSIAREDYDPEQYEVIEGWVDDGHIKHDITLYYSIIRRKVDNTFWKVEFMVSYSDGLDIDNIESWEVERKEVVTIAWMAKQ
jgi:hypothetical protein